MTALYTSPFDPPTWRKTIWSITSVFESSRPEGNPAAYQNIDSGIISYGKHQATLASGNLFRVLQEYFQRSQSSASKALQNEYADRVRNGDPTLRDDPRIRDLLLQAATEAAMSDAQDAVFDKNFYQPAIQQAQGLAVTSPLALACIYDTRIQGGLQTVLDGITTKLGGNVIGQPSTVIEETWIDTFLNEREAFLNRLADKADSQGKTADAKALRISTFRVTELRALAQARNYGLSGPFKVRGQSIAGIMVVVQAISALKILSYSGPTPAVAIRLGTPFTAIWRVKNTGTTTWGPGYLLAHQASPNNTSLANKLVYQLAEVASPSTVPPNGETTITVQMTATVDLDGQYRDELRFRDDQGQAFGDALAVTVAISRQAPPTARTQL